MIYPRYEVCLWSDTPEGALKCAAKVTQAYRAAFPGDNEIGCVLQCHEFKQGRIGEVPTYHWCAVVTTENEFEPALTIGRKL